MTTIFNMPILGSLTQIEWVAAIILFIAWFTPVVLGFVFTKIKIKQEKRNFVWTMFLLAFGLYNVVYWPIADYLGHLFLTSF